MDAGEASLVGIGTLQEIAGPDAVSGPWEMEAFEGTAEGELGLQVAVLSFKSLGLGLQLVDTRLGLSGGFRAGFLGCGELVHEQLDLLLQACVRRFERFDLRLVEVEQAGLVSLDCRFRLGEFIGKG